MKLLMKGLYQEPLELVLNIFTKYLKEGVTNVDAVELNELHKLKYCLLINALGS